MARLTARFELQDRITRKLRLIRGDMERLDRLRRRSERPITLRIRDNATIALRRVQRFILRDLARTYQLTLDVNDLATKALRKFNGFLQRKMPRTHSVLMRIKDQATPGLVRLRRYIDRKFGKVERFAITVYDRATAGIKRIASYAARQLGRGYSYTIRAVDMVRRTVSRIASYTRHTLGTEYRVAINAIDRFTAPVRGAVSFANTHLGRTYTTTIKVLDLITKPLRGIVTAVTSTLGLLGVGAGATGGIVVPLKMVADRQNMTTAFETLLGSRGKADARLDELTAFAGQTPFTRDEIFESSRVLQVFTGNALSTTEGMKLVGDVAAGVQRPFSEVALWMGRLYDGIKSGRPIGDATAALQEMGAISGDARGKLEKLAKSGKDINKTWPEVTKEFGKYNDMMIKMSDNLANLFLGVKSFINNSILMPWGKGLAAAFQPALEAFRTWRGEYSFVLTDLSNKAEKAGKKFANSFLDPTKSVFGFIGDQFKILFPGEKLTKKQTQELKVKFKDNPKLKKHFEQLEKYRNMDFETRWKLVLDNTKDVFGEWWEKTGKPGLFKMAENVGKTYGGIINGVINGLLGIDDKQSEDSFTDAGAKAGRIFIESFLEALDPGQLGIRIAKKIGQLNLNALTGEGSIAGALIANAFALAFLGKVATLLKPLKSILSGAFAVYKWGKGLRGGMGAGTSGGVIGGVGGARPPRNPRPPEYRQPWINRGEPVRPTTPNQGRGGGGLLGSIGKGAKSIGKRIPILGTLIAATELIGMNNDNKGEKIGGFAGNLGGGIGGAALGTLIAPGIGTAIGGILGSIFGGDLGNWIGKMFDDGTIKKKWDELVKGAENAVQWIKDTWSTVSGWFNDNVLTPITTFFSDTWTWITEKWDQLSSWFMNNVWLPIYNFAVPIINFVVGVFVVGWELISTVWGAASTWFNDNVWTPYGQVAVAAITLVWNKIVELWNWIQITWSVFSAWFMTYVWEPFGSVAIEAIVGVWNKLTEFWNWVQFVWGMFAVWFDTFVWQPFINVGLPAIMFIWNLFKNTWNWIKTSWVVLATWFDEYVWQPYKKYAEPAIVFVSTKFDEAWQTIKGIWDGVSGWFEKHVFSPLQNFAATLKETWDGIFGVVGNVVGKIKEVSGKAFKFFESKGEEKTGWKPKGKKEERNATGGYITKPTLSWIGEAGKEFVIPTENNKGRGKMLLAQAASHLGMSVMPSGASPTSPAGSPSPMRPAAASSVSASASGSVSIGETGNASKYGEQFSADFEKGLNSKVVSLEQWKQANIKQPFTQIQASTPLYGVQTVTGFAAGQNMTPTGTGQFLDQNVRQPFLNARQESPTWGAGLIDAFNSGMRSKGSEVTQAAKDMAKKVEQAFREELDIHSPSRVMMSLGKFASIGVVKGLDSVDVKKFAENQAGSLIAAFSGMGASNLSVQQWLMAALMATGTSMSWLPGLMTIAQNESRGNPKAINLWDSNAKRGTPSKGLMQTIDPTFNSNKASGMNDIWNPIHNAAAAINYIKGRYGNVYNTPGLRSIRNGGPYKGYANGGLITQEQIARVGEGNKREWIIPEERGIRGRYLLAQAAQALGMDVYDPTNAASSELSQGQVQTVTAGTASSPSASGGSKQVIINFNGEQHYHNGQDAEGLAEKIKQMLIDELENEINTGTKGVVLDG
ncbi:transglycosylase SLT domain-containing protein [Bacillus pumilus]|uniref:transglycosylase SLT domain-containing protein n=1 Tax=Bacillus TaxID=1386 RepID=UPI000DDE429F|nr:transglycosylase SLT domain-containing protein [Bacillus pumilus]MCY7500690.1 transglycosylase SLT domain-containing protein [Bacillus pumilus]MCY7526524.1 transglycosylase SLT domain-containing protein [Bacillus pumilus]MED4439047.1 transglycosylase SLT domain-containing protein [Bacillus pumilus]MED4491440.1 transglycosylase SLT domain-containing protein [Bacillus pumilus]MED4628018.1 transglycosylase SLT domain-containing protein [Bacillus pumilus]